MNANERVVSVLWAGQGGMFVAPYASHEPQETGSRTHSLSSHAATPPTRMVERRDRSITTTMPQRHIDPDLLDQDKVAHTRAHPSLLHDAHTPC